MQATETLVVHPAGANVQHPQLGQASDRLPCLFDIVRRGRLTFGYRNLIGVIEKIVA